MKLSQLKIDGNFCACLSLLKIHPSGHLCQPFFHLFEGNRQCQIFNCDKLHQEDTSHSFSLKNNSRIGSQSSTVSKFDLTYKLLRAAVEHIILRFCVSALILNKFRGSGTPG